MRSIILLLATFMSHEAFAAKCCNTPTIWTFKNTAKSPVTLSCALDSSSANPPSPVTMKTPSIAAGGSYEHSWGANWDNDGMGMIPGKWTCQNIDPKKPASKTADVKFTTDWGENVVVTWKESELTVAKVDTVLKDSKATKAN